MKAIWLLLRPKQWIKNVFIFAPLFFSFSFSMMNKLKVTVYTFIIFSIAASGIYIINDILDSEQDKQHPLKKFRPIPNGQISSKTALILSLLFILTSLTFSYLLNRILFVIVFAYIVNNILYSLGFKSISILDVIMISIGFLLRIIAGGVAANIKISMWILIMTFLLAIFLALAKRRDDILLHGNGMKIRKNI